MENGMKQKTKNRKQIYFEAKMEGRLYGESGTKRGTYSYHIRFLLRKRFQLLVCCSINNPFYISFPIK